MKWGKVKAGDVVELKGAEWTVVKAKRKGDRVRVTVTGRPGTFTRDVDAAVKVPLVEQAKAGPLHDERGAQRRWATPDDLAPPSKGAKWGEPASDKPGALVETVLGGRLVATVRDGEAWAVPPIDLTTVRAHLAIFHGVAGNEQPVDESRALALHRELHEAADHEPAQPHEHTKRASA